MIDIPSADLPKALDIPQMYFRPPTADVPAYKPMIVPPADLERPRDTEAEPTTEEPEPPKLTIPVLDIQMPVPENSGSGNSCNNSSSGSGNHLYHSIFI